jgi:hypothetical protein
MALAPVYRESRPGSTQLTCTFCGSMGPQASPRTSAPPPAPVRDANPRRLRAQQQDGSGSISLSFPGKDFPLGKFGQEEEFGQV